MTATEMIHATVDDALRCVAADDADALAKVLANVDPKHLQTVVARCAFQAATDGRVRVYESLSQVAEARLWTFNNIFWKLIPAEMNMEVTSRRRDAAAWRATKLVNPRILQILLQDFEDETHPRFMPAERFRQLVAPTVAAVYGAEAAKVLDAWTSSPSSPSSPLYERRELLCSMLGGARSFEGAEALAALTTDPLVVLRALRDVVTYTRMADDDAGRLAVAEALCRRLVALAPQAPRTLSLALCCTALAGWCELSMQLIEAGARPEHAVFAAVLGDRRDVFDALMSSWQSSATATATQPDAARPDFTLALDFPWHAAMAAALVRGDARSWAALDEVLPKATFADVQKAHWLASSASGASHTTFPVLCNGFKVLHEEMKYHLGLEC